MSTELTEQLQGALGAGYRIERELGGGGMSRVFTARDTTLGRRVVVKILPSDVIAPASIERFKREIRLAASLQHPHIVPVLGAGEAGAVPFYTMPFVNGESLRERLARLGELAGGEAVQVLRDVAKALAYAHAEGVVHRDIKPGNIILSGGVAVVTDFGVAKALAVAEGRERPEGDSPEGPPDFTLTSVGVALGTPAYMAPEQASADPHVDHRADIYALGCVGYEMLCGSTPFGSRSPQQMLAAHIVETPESLGARRPNVPPALVAVIMRCLEKRPADRPQSAEELLAALDEVTTPSVGTLPAGAPRAATRVRRRGLYVIAAAVAAMAAVAAWLSMRDPEPITLSATHLVSAGPEPEVDPAISPDGKLVAYAAGPLNAMRIFVRQVGGGPAVPVSATIGGDHRWPRWAPNGSQIAFVADGAIYVVPALGGTPRLTIERGRLPLRTPAWSPDGTRLAYSDESAIWTRDVDGGWRGGSRRASTRTRQCSRRMARRSPTCSAITRSSNSSTSPGARSGRYRALVEPRCR